MQSIPTSSENKRCFRIIDLPGGECEFILSLPKDFEVIKIDPLQREKYAYHEMLICFKKYAENVETKIKLVKPESEISDNEIVLGALNNPLRPDLYIVIKST